MTTNFNEWDELDKRGKPRATYTNARVALNRMGAECHAYLLSDDTYQRTGHQLRRTYWELPDCSDSDRPFQRRPLEAWMLRDAIINAFGFDPGEKPLAEAVAAVKRELWWRIDRQRRELPVLDTPPAQSVGAWDPAEGWVAVDEADLPMVAERA
jgi:hypothetical protein